ncbi:hypothetical protein C0992_002012, partial [Termitomyces sp. T32_za158]
MADSGGQPPGLSEPHGGSSATQTPSALKYQPLPKRDDQVTRDISESFGMPIRMQDMSAEPVPRFPIHEFMEHKYALL